MNNKLLGRLKDQIVETNKYKILVGGPNVQCPKGHRGLVRVLNKENNQEYYSCDKCDAFYDIGEIDDSVKEAGIFQPPSPEEAEKRKGTQDKLFMVYATHYYLGDVYAKSEAEARQKAADGEVDITQSHVGVDSEDLTDEEAYSFVEVKEGVLPTNPADEVDQKYIDVLYEKHLKESGPAVGDAVWTDTDKGEVVSIGALINVKLEQSEEEASVSRRDLKWSSDKGGWVLR